MTDISDNKNATNYSVQPGYSKDYPPQATPMNPKDHPAANVPTATEDHQGTVRSIGTDRLRTQFQQSDANNWMDSAGKDSQTIDTLVRGR